MTTIKITFHQLKSKSNGKKEAPIYYRISLKGQAPIKRTTGYVVNVEHWDKKNKIVKPKNSKAFEINNGLSKIRDQIELIYSSLKKENECVLISFIPKLLKTNNQDSGSLINTYDEFISHIKRREGIDYTSGTIRHHETNRNHLKKFINQHY